MANPSQRVGSVVPFLAMDVLARARVLERQGRDIVHFELGEPDFPTPERIKQAGLQALTDNITHYTAARGEHELVEAIVNHYYQRYGVRIAHERVLVSAGTSPVLLMAFMAGLDAGDQILLPRPYYPCYPNFARLAGAEPVFVEARAESGFRIQAADLKRAMTPKTKAILINSPGNPTGAVLTGESLREIASLGPLIIADEIYHGLVYEGEEHSILQYTDQAIVLNGFSKAYSMTGWRLGYAIVPENFVRPMEVLQQNIIISANSFAQRGGYVALTDPEVQTEIARMKSQYDERRRMMIEGVRTLGLEIPVAPTGAFYVLADARKFTNDSMALAARMLEEAGVAVTPGDDFGAAGFIRFSYTTSKERIVEGLNRLKAVLR